MPYDPMLVQPMRDELTKIGVQELRTPQEVESAFSEKGSTMVVINSVCGCAAGSARPAVALALQHNNRPDRVVTVFAGQDIEATQRARDYFTNQPPSSPSIAILQDGQLTHMIHRHHIEGRPAEMIASALKGVFDEIAESAKA